MQNHTPRRPSLIWPLLLIAVGSLLLLQNFGLLPAGLWPALLQLWPVLIILIGLDMLIGRRSNLGALAVVLIGVLIIAGSLIWASLQAQALPPGGLQSLIQTPRGAQSAAVEVDFAVGEFNLSALGASDQLMEGQAQNGPGESVRQSYEIDEGVGTLKLEQQRQALVAPFIAARQPETQWDIQLTRDLPLSLNIRTGVGHAILDLSGLSLTALNLSTGVGQAEVTFPARGAMRAEVETGVGEVILTIPGDLPARLTIASGLANVNIPARFSRSGNTYTTSGFDISGDYLELELKAGLGSVTVK